MVIAVSMVKDEADVIEQTVGHMQRQVDHVIVADNGSSDGTREILERLGVEILDDPDPAYYQQHKMSFLAEKARQQGARWVVPFDADEVWLSHEDDIATTLRRLPKGAYIAAADLFDHVASAEDPGGPPVLSIGWRRAQRLPLPKVACRAVEGLVIHQGNHGATFPNVPYPLAVLGMLQVRHFPYRSVEQMIRKARNGAAAYAATDLPEDVGGHWRGYGRLTDDEIGDVFRRWFWSADPASDPALIYDPAEVVGN